MTPVRRNQEQHAKVLIELKYIGGGPVSWGLMLREIRACKNAQVKNGTTYATRALLLHEPTFRPFLLHRRSCLAQHTPLQCRSFDCWPQMECAGLFWLLNCLVSPSHFLCACRRSTCPFDTLTGETRRCKSGRHRRHNNNQPTYNGSKFHCATTLVFGL